MYERFKQAPNKIRKGLIWLISVIRAISKALKWQIHGLNELQLSPYFRENGGNKGTEKL